MLTLLLYFLTNMFSGELNRSSEESLSCIKLQMQHPVTQRLPSEELPKRTCFWSTVESTKETKAFTSEKVKALNIKWDTKGSTTFSILEKEKP